jgi:hypothetical protein
MALLCALTLGFAWMMLPADAAAAAATKNKNLTKARKAYEDLDYTKAQSLLQKALKGQTTFEDQIEIYALLATVHAIYGRDEMAQSAFFEVLKRNPETQLPPDTSPKIKAAFAQAREAWQANGAPRISPTALGDGGLVRNGGDATDSDEDKLESSSTPTASLAGQPPARAVVVPLNPLMTGGVGYETGEPIYKRWWFWTIVGVVVVGGGGAATWYLSRPQVPAHDFGPFPVN